MQCGPCKAIAPAWAKLAAEHGPAILFVKVDVDDNGSTAEAAGIRSVPTFKAFFGGKEVATFAGANEGSLRKLATELAARA